jgi:hypothetical protein
MLSDAGLKLDAIRTLLPCVLNDRPELDLYDEVRAPLTHESGGIEKHFACLEASRDVLRRCPFQHEPFPRKPRQNREDQHVWLLRQRPVREHWFDDVATEAQRITFIGSLDG